MIEETSYPKLFESPIIYEKVICGIEIRIFENGLHYLKVPDYQHLSIEAVGEIRSWIAKFSASTDYKYCNVIEFMSSAGLDPEVREWAAKSGTSSSSIADAVIIKGLAHKLVANFYLNFNRPKKPTKFFNDLKSAIFWSKEELGKS